MGKYYTVYLKKTDEVVAFGNPEICSKMLQLSPKNNFNSFHSLVKKAKKGNTGYEVFIEDVDDLGEDS